MAKRRWLSAMMATVIVAAVGLGASAQAAPASAGCPYRFGSEMPPDTFCVYRGTARASGGEVCDDDVVMLWSGYAAAGESNADIYLGFIAAPDLVLRATVTPQDDEHERAQVVEYTVGDSEPARPIGGEASLRAPSSAAQASADGISLALSRGIDLKNTSGCRFTAYSGEFMGMIGPSLETAASH